MERKIVKAYMRLIFNDDVYCVSDGYIFIEDDYFEGFMTCDYIAASYDEKENKTYLDFLFYDFDRNLCGIQYFETDNTLQFDYSDTFTFWNPKSSSLKLILSIAPSELTTSKNNLESNLKDVKYFLDIPYI